MTWVLHWFVQSLTIIDTYIYLLKDNTNMHGMHANKYKETTVSLTQPLLLLLLFPVSHLRTNRGHQRIWGVVCILDGMWTIHGKYYCIFFGCDSNRHSIFFNYIVYINFFV